MNITTKFSVGDQVYAILEQKIGWGTVSAVEIKTYESTVEVIYRVKFTYNGNEFTHVVYEETIFEKVDDLMDYLRVQLEKDLETYQKNKKVEKKKPATSSDWSNVKSWTP